ncbi:uncharacterized protein [Haliotis cracherodii]|uniref:uncharacterized protein n=1 Tax=Haliotis cracherodii TaxID=6455 RepID=UPI0039ED6396
MKSATLLMLLFVCIVPITAGRVKKESGLFCVNCCGPPPCCNYCGRKKRSSQSLLADALLGKRAKALQQPEGMDKF